MISLFTGSIYYTENRCYCDKLKTQHKWTRSFEYLWRTKTSIYVSVCACVSMYVSIYVCLYMHVYRCWIWNKRYCLWPLQVLSKKLKKCQYRSVQLVTSQYLQEKVIPGTQYSRKEILSPSCYCEAVWVGHNIWAESKGSEFRRRMRYKIVHLGGIDIITIAIGKTMKWINIPLGQRLVCTLLLRHSIEWSFLWRDTMYVASESSQIVGFTYDL